MPQAIATKIKPTKAPTLGPSTIAPISVGTCRVVTLRGPNGIIPYPDTPNAIVIPANKPIMVSSRIVIPLFFSFLTFLRSTGLVVSLPGLIQLSYHPLDVHCCS